MNLHKKLRLLFQEIATEAKANPAFAERLASALGSGPRGDRSDAQSDPQEPGSDSKRPNRRAKAVLDPHTTYRSEGIDALRQRLCSLNINQLKDIVADFAMDHSKLALKWKTPDRLVGLIVDTVVSRSKKGEAFMSRTEPTEGPRSSDT